MNTQELAKAFTDMCTKGELEAAGKKFWSDDIVSREPMTGDMAVLKGRKAVEGKSQWWNANHEVHNFKAEGPYVHGDQFVVRFKAEVTPKGQKRTHLGNWRSGWDYAPPMKKLSSTILPFRTVYSPTSSK